ncbi:MAG: DUF937 domain-containing protein [Pseudomonadota bacterium]
MNLLELLNQAGGGDGIAKLGRGLGLDPALTQTLARQLAPAIAGGAKRRARAEGGLGVLLGALQGEGQAAYAREPERAAAPEAQAQGAAFLDDLLGAPEARPRLAETAAQRTGADPSIVGQFLPALAAMALGAMQQKAPDAEIGAMRGALGGGMDRAGAGIGDLLSTLGGASSGAAPGGGAGALVGSLLGGLLGGRARSAAPQAGGGLGDLLAMLDRDGDGTPMDDVLDMIMRR